MATWDDYTTCWLPKPGVAARYTLEFDGKGRFLMRPIDPAGESAPGAFAGGSVLTFCEMLAASLPGCVVTAEPSEPPWAVADYCNRWRDVAAALSGTKSTPRRAAARAAYSIRRKWVAKYVTRAAWDVPYAPTALGLAADARYDAEKQADDAKLAETMKAFTAGAAS